MAVVARRRSPDRRVRILQWLGVHATRRHLPGRSVERDFVAGPAVDDVPDRFLPHGACRVRIDAEALQLRARRRPPGAEVHATVGEQVEHRHRFRRPDRVVVGLRHEAHAVAEPDPARARRDRAVENLRVRAVRVLVEKMMLDAPEGIPAPFLAGEGLFQGLLVGTVLGAGSPGPGDGDFVEERELHDQSSRWSARVRSAPLHLYETRAASQRSAGRRAAASGRAGGAGLVPRRPPGDQPGGSGIREPAGRPPAWEPTWPSRSVPACRPTHSGRVLSHTWRGRSRRGAAPRPIPAARSPARAGRRPCP